MSFPENTPPPTPEPLAAGFPADAAAPQPEQLPEPVLAQQLFRRYERPPASPGRTVALHLGLFVLTLVTTTLAGVVLTRGTIDLLPLGFWEFPAAPQPGEWARGLAFALPFLGVLTVHEFGHYFVARYNRVRTSLPYYIPFPLGLGTFGAVIRIRERIFSRREFFDIGLAGPLTGFVVAVGLLVYGFTHLPPLDSIRYEIREYSNSTDALILARPLLYRWLEAALADPARLPHPIELMHYPYLLAGALSLFFTALNLLPMGQLDGGHILYGLLGPHRSNRLMPWLFSGFIFYAGLGLFSLRSDWQTWAYWAPVYAGYLALLFWRVLPQPRQGLVLAAGIWLAQVAAASYWPGLLGNPGWLAFGLLLGRFTGIYHPPAPDERPLSRGRQLLGWLMLAIFVVCFTPSPFK